MPLLPRLPPPPPPAHRTPRGVERSVDFLLSPRLGQAYQGLKEHGANLPLVGKTVFLPSVEAAEGVTRFFLVVVQAPLPSAESVANVAEVSVCVCVCMWIFLRLASNAR